MKTRTKYNNHYCIGNKNKDFIQLLYINLMEQKISVEKSETKKKQK